MTVTDHISNSLRASIQSTGEAPCRLTLTALSEYFEVSLTPVRLAAEALIKEGILNRKENGRLEVSPTVRKQRPSSDQIIAPKAIRGNQLDDIISNEIITRSLKHNTEYLREEATAEKYGAGRTIIRQIFSRQAGAGMIEHVPRCGWRVRPFNERDMLDYLEIREILELKAMDLARPHFKEEELKILLNYNKPGKKKNAANLDDSLHAYWIDRCHNRYIQEFFERYSKFYSTLFDYAAIKEPVKKEMAQEHCDIIENLLRHDWRRARKALSKHIRDQQTNVDRVVDYLNRRRT